MLKSVSLSVSENKAKNKTGLRTESSPGPAYGRFGIHLTVRNMSINSFEGRLVVSLKENLEHQVLHAVLEVQQSMLQKHVSGPPKKKKGCSNSALGLIGYTLSQSVMPLPRAISASIKFSVSS